MPKKKESHVFMGDHNNIFCDNCGVKMDLPMPIGPGMFGAIARQFEKDHKNCQKTKPQLDPSASMETRKEWWKKYGYMGTSSKTIYTVLTGENIMKGTSFCHPQDPSDFYRCHMLLEAVPEFRNMMDMVAGVSREWGLLVKGWDELTALCEEQIAGKKNNMYEVMQNIYKYAV